MPCLRYHEHYQFTSPTQSTTAESVPCETYHLNIFSSTRQNSVKTHMYVYKTNGNWREETAARTPVGVLKFLDVPTRAVFHGIPRSYCKCWELHATLHAPIAAPNTDNKILPQHPPDTNIKSDLKHSKYTHSSVHSLKRDNSILLASPPHFSKSCRVWTVSFNAPTAAVWPSTVILHLAQRINLLRSSTFHTYALHIA